MVRAGCGFLSAPKITETATLSPTLMSDRFEAVAEERLGFSVETRLYSVLSDRAI